jgi:tetratricopeptide (TPR) repeat protein
MILLTDIRQLLTSVFVRIVAVVFFISVGSGCMPTAKRSRVLQRAEHYFKNGDYDKARIEYLNLLRLDQTNPTAIKQLGTIWFEDGDPVRALPYLKAARDLDPNNLDIRTKLASTLLMLGEPVEARKEALSILQQSPSSSEALLTLAESVRTEQELKEVEQQIQQIKVPESSALHLILGSLAVRKNDATTAEKELQRALDLEPKSPVVHMVMANFYLSRKELQHAGEELKAAAELAPIRSTHRLRYMDFQARNGALNDAKAELKEITRQAPDYLPAWVFAAQLAFNEKKYEESLSLLENVTSRSPENIDAHILRAQALMAKGESKKAVTDLQALDETYPNVPGIKYYLARAYAQNNDSKQAIAELNKALVAKPDYVEAMLMLAELNLRAGNFQAVVAAMTDLLKKRPDMSAAQTLLTEAYRSMGRLDEAATAVREQIKASPRNAQAYFLLGVILRQQNKAAEAREAFQKTLELAPDNLMAIDQLVELDIASNNVESAMGRVQAVLQKAPKSAPLHLLEAKVYFAQQAWDQAEASVRKALDLDQNLQSAYELLISIYVATNRLPQAINELQAYLSKWPDDLRARMTLGGICEKQKEPLKARDAYEQILARDPEFVPALNNLAYLYADKLNEIDKAHDLAQKARGLRPEPAIADTLGWVLYKKGDYQEALALFQESAGKLAQNPDAQFHLGLASYMMGQPEAARAAFKQALNTGADFAGKEEAQRRLALLDQVSSVALSNEQLESILKQQPDDPLARLHLAESYEKQKAFTQAATEYERALKINPKLLSAVIKLAQLNAGPLQNSEKALELANKARELAPTDANVAAILGQIAYRTGNFTWAYSLLQESARQLAADPNVLHNYAWAAYSLGKVSQARELMQRGLQLAPASSISEDSKSFLSMTAVDKNPKDPAALEQEIQKLLKADPNYAPALTVRAAIEERRGEIKRAIDTYNEILQRFPDFAPAQKHLAALYLKDPSALDRAYEFAVKARRTLSDDPELARTLGEISYQRKEYSRALELLQESARTTPLDAKGLYYLGMSHLEAKQGPQAREALERALAAGLQEPLASEAKRLLAESKPN